MLYVATVDAVFTSSNPHFASKKLQNIIVRACFYAFFPAGEVFFLAPEVFIPLLRVFSPLVSVFNPYVKSEKPKVFRVKS